MPLRTARFKQPSTDDEISRKYCCGLCDTVRQYGSTLGRFFGQSALPCLRHPKNIILSICSRGNRLGGFVTLAAAREEARAAGLTSWDIFQGNVRIERHDPGVDDPVGIPKEAEAIADEAGDNLAIIGPAAAE